MFINQIEIIFVIESWWIDHWMFKVKKAALAGEWHIGFYTKEYSKLLHEMNFSRVVLLKYEEKNRTNTSY